MLFFLFIAFILFSVTNSFAQGLDNALTDPTRPAAIMAVQNADGGSQQTAGVYKVSQIYISQKKQLAIINGQKVKMGDRVDGAEVLAIKSGSVHLLVDGGISEISITPSIKRYQK